MKKTLVVGLDAACWEYLDPLLQAGEMPRLQELMAAGTSGTLQSTIPAWTPTAWASICTGKNPGKHGIFDMLWRRPGTTELVPVDSGIRRGTPFWQRLHERQVRVGLVNIPFSYPPEPVEGFCVCGFGTPASARNVTFPPALLQKLEETSGPFQPVIETSFLLSASPEAIFCAERQHQSRQVQIALACAQHHPVDVLAINLMFTDHANHKMPHLDQVQAAYRASDADLAELIDRFQPDNVMVISDHGSSRLRGNFLLGAWLQDHGYYIEAENDALQRSMAINWVLMQYLQSKHGWSGLSEKIIRRLLRELLLRLPDRSTKAFWEKLEGAVPMAQERVRYAGQPDYERTQVFPGSVFSALLYLNSGNDPHMSATPHKSAAPLLSELAERLLEIEDPDTGSRLFSNVYRSDQLYTGPATAHGPDLILDGYGARWNIQASPFRDTPKEVVDRYFVVPSQARDFGWHSRDGIFVFSGTDFTRGQSSLVGHVMDVPATLLHLYGVPIPQDYDGRVLVECLAAELQACPVQWQPGDPAHDETGTHAFSVEETAQLTAHLKALGYLA